ncbi:MAG: transposase [Desulfomicrobium escambiense]|nr:transposase [Desulfomicrobium escambiense]
MSPLPMLPIPRNLRNSLSKTSPFLIHLPSVPIRDMQAGRTADLLADHGYEDGIMHKAARGKPLTLFQRLINRIISSVRYRVEQGMGTLKKHYGFTRMRYLGLSRGNMDQYSDTTEGLFWAIGFELAPTPQH